MYSGQDIVLCVITVHICILVVQQLLYSIFISYLSVSVYKQCEKLLLKQFILYLVQVKVTSLALYTYNRLVPIIVDPNKCVLMYLWRCCTGDQARVVVEMISGPICWTRQGGRSERASVRSRSPRTDRSPRFRTHVCYVRTLPAIIRNCQTAAIKIKNKNFTQFAIVVQ